MDDRELVRLGADSGHRVTVTPLGPAWVTACECRMPPARRASKHQGNLAGLAHLRDVLQPDVEPSREQRVEAAEDRAEQAAFDAARERSL